MGATSRQPSRLGMGGWVGGAAAAVLVLTATGCTALRSAGRIESGESVAAHVTCRLPNGGVVATTDLATATDAGIPKSPLFIPRRQYEPLGMTAGEPSRHDPWLSFEQEIAVRLAPALVGLTPGERHQLTLTAEPIVERQGDERFLKLARVRKRARELVLSRGEYETRTGRSPANGQRLVIDPLLPGTVAGVADERVTIAFRPVSEQVTTPFGPAVIRDTGDGYEIVLDPAVGSLVRSGPLAGRISAVDEGAFTVDFGHPFGGEQLRCDVRVERP